MRMRVALALIAAAGCAVAGAAQPGLVVLCTDYGADSIYVGILKGAICSKAPEVRIESLTNSIPPYDLFTGAAVLAEGCASFPAGTVFCAIVDPGVGTARAPIAFESGKGQFFVGPDNGLFAAVAERDGVRAVRRLENTALWRDGADTSSTFHGRDIFGPAAAMIAAGTPLEQCGPAHDGVLPLDLPKPRLEDGTIHGAVVRTDDYGNVVTNIPGGLLDKAGIALGDTVTVTLGAARFDAPRTKTYADVPDGAKLVCIQSAGMVELAINKASLAKVIGAKPRTEVALKKARRAP